MVFLEEMEAGWLKIKDMDTIVNECRSMAHKLRLDIRWRIKEHTATAFLRYDKETLWKKDFTHSYAHVTLCLMYAGVHTELKRRLQLIELEKQRMQQEDYERRLEKGISELPTWGEKRKK